MDRHKYRAYDPDTGYMWHSDKEGECQIFHIEADNGLHAGLEGETEDWTECKLMQCTGLKDMKGALLFEGDIIRDTKGDSLEVVWDDYYSSFVMIYDGDESAFMNAPEIETFEIIGNLHQNPELLLETKEN